MTLSTMEGNWQFIFVSPAKLGASQVQDHVLFSHPQEHTTELVYAELK